MGQVKFGWVVPAIGPVRNNHVPLAITQQETILPAAARYFDSLWVYDHFFDLGDRTNPWLESWTTLTWLAARFPTLQIGTLVLGLGYRNPALLAKMAATLQALSDGRLILGLGAGWREEEYHAYGYPFPKTGERIQQLDEAIQIIRLMWTDPAPTFRGTYFQIENATCLPQPDLPPSIMIGSMGARILPLVARQADAWDVWAWTPDAWDPAGYQRKWDLLRGHAEAAGRDPMMIFRSIAATGAKLPRNAEDSARWLERLRPFVDLGVGRFTLDFGTVPSTEPIERFAAEVIAPLNEQ
jgi:alkanesulfonate monooxygenase SsuD/methylene tetrahydromethanopterin reductase-like flavin-dependent oxidoreductase (luciferase family)